MGQTAAQDADGPIAWPTSEDFENSTVTGTTTHRRLIGTCGMNLAGLTVC